MRLLLIEDNEAVRTGLQQGLQEAGYAVDSAADGSNGRWFMEHNDYELIILDLMLPDVDGLRLLRELRSTGSDTTVLILSARDAIEDRIAGLDAGADDYLVKPFALGEILARIRALVRRRNGRADSLIQISDLTIDCAKHSVTWGDTPIRLTAKEFSLLEFMALREGVVVSQTDIWEALYDFESEPGSNIVAHFMARLRRKIERAGAPALIETRRGEGYVMRSNPC